MGKAGRRTLGVGLTAPARIQLGWVPATAVRTVTTTTTVVLTDLDAMLLDPTGDAVAILRIPTSPDVADSPYFRDYFYVALRGGAVDVHGVETAPADTDATEWLHGNTLQRLKKDRAAGLYRDKSGRFVLEWSVRETGDALVTVRLQ